MTQKTIQSTSFYFFKLTLFAINLTNTHVHMYETLHTIQCYIHCTHSYTR